MLWPLPLPRGQSTGSQLNLSWKPVLAGVQAGPEPGHLPVQLQQLLCLLGGERVLPWVPGEGPLSAAIHGAVSAGGWVTVAVPCPKPRCHVR